MKRDEIRLASVGILLPQLSLVLALLFLFGCSEVSDHLRGCPGGGARNDDGRCFTSKMPSPIGDAPIVPEVSSPSDAGASTGCTHQAGVLINEVLYNPSGADAGAEFVELLGPSEFSAEGLYLGVLNGSSGEFDDGKFALHGTASSDGIFLVGAELVAAANQLLSVGVQNGPDSLVLFGCDQTTALDAVAWGGFDDDDVDAAELFPADLAPEGKSLARCDGAVDSNDNQADFSAATPTPGARNSADFFADVGRCSGSGVELPIEDLADDLEVVEMSEGVGEIEGCVPFSESVVISEVLANPEGADGDGEAEFLEISSEPGARASGLRVLLINGADGSTYGEVNLTGNFDESGLLLVGGDGIAERDMLAPIAFQNGPDAILLVDCIGAVLETLDYGSSADSPLQMVEGQSLSRCGNLGEAGLFVATSPTPGQQNLCAEPAPACEPTGLFEVTISEVLVNPDGPDGAGENEFLRIDFQESARSRLPNLRVRLIDGPTGNTYGQDVPLLDPGAGKNSILIGGVAVSGRDLAAPAPIQNGPDAIIILDCTDYVVDAVAYGPEDSAHIWYVEGESAITPPEGQALHRVSTTLNHRADFVAGEPSL